MDIKYIGKMTDELYEIANNIGIIKEHIKFTNFVDKYKFLKSKNFMFHLDDDHIELLLINNNTNVKGIDVLQSDWKEQCEKIIKQ